MAPSHWYEIHGAKAHAAEIHIFGDIGESWLSDESITAKGLVADLAAIDAEEITVRLNSYGGSVSDGLAIYNALRRKDAKITTTVEGVAMSIASLIFMAGDQREMAANSLLMIHAPWGAAVGNAVDMRDMAETLDKYAEAMASTYMRSGKSREEVMALLQDGVDHFYTAEEAKAEGFADAVTGELPVAARYLNNRFMPAPRPVSITSKRKTPMTEKTEAAGTASAAESPNLPEIEAAALKKAQAALADRTREIRLMFKPFAARSDAIAKLRDDSLDDVSIPLDTVSARLLAELAKDSEPLAGSRFEAGETAGEKFAAAAVAAIRTRCGLEKRDPQNEWTGRKLIELARASLELQGVICRGLLPIEIASRALVRNGYRGISGAQTTSDFDVVLENTLHKALLQAYNNTPDTWSKICRIGSVGDLRAWLRLQPGSIGDIDTVDESGEYKNKIIPDAVKESITARRRGNIIAVTPEVLINDDLSYFSAVPDMFGRAANRTIESAFYTLLTSASAAGPTLTETGAALFSATHGNLTTSGAAPSVTTIDAGRQILAAQTDPSGNEYLGIVPAIWLGPLSLGGTARVVNGSQYDPNTSTALQKANMVYGIFSQIIDSPRLTGTAWYMFADPNVMPVFEVVFLDGQREPLLTQDVDFRSSGLAWKVELPFGVGCIGWRGAYQNDGAT